MQTVCVWFVCGCWQRASSPPHAPDRSTNKARGRQDVCPCTHTLTHIYTHKCAICSVHPKHGLHLLVPCYPHALPYMCVRWNSHHSPWHLLSLQTGVSGPHRQPGPPTPRPPPDPTPHPAPAAQSHARALAGACAQAVGHTRRCHCAVGLCARAGPCRARDVYGSTDVSAAAGCSCVGSHTSVRCRLH